MLVVICLVAYKLYMRMNNQTTVAIKNGITVIRNKNHGNMIIGKLHTIELQPGHKVEAVKIMPEETREVTALYQQYDTLQSKCPIQSETDSIPGDCEAFNSYAESTRVVRKALNTRLAKKYGVIINGCYAEPFGVGFNYDKTYSYMTDNASGGSHANTIADDNYEICIPDERVVQSTNDKTKISDGAWGTKNTMIELSQKEAEIMTRLNQKYQMDNLYIKNGNPTFIRESVRLKQQMNAIIYPYIKDNPWFDGGWMCANFDETCSVIIPYSGVH